MLHKETGIKSREKEVSDAQGVSRRGYQKGVITTQRKMNPPPPPPFISQLGGTK